MSATKKAPEQVDTPAAEIVLAAGAPAKPDPDAQENWDEAIEEFKARDYQNLESVLITNWDKGRFLNELLTEKAKYGNRTVDNFAIAMRVSREMAYAYHRFHERFTTQEVQEAVQLGANWSIIFNLLSLHPADKVRRRELMAKAASSQISIDDLKKQTASINVATKEKLVAAGKKVEKRGGSNIGTTFKSTTSMCHQACAKADEFMESYRQYEQVTDPARKAELEERLKETRKALKTTGETIARALKRLDDTK